MAGDLYHYSEDVALCEAHAPTFQDMLNDPGSFYDRDLERHMTADEAAAVCDAYVKAGGSLSDKMVERADGEA